MELSHRFVLTAAPATAPLAARVRDALYDAAGRAAMQDLRWPTVFARLEAMRDEGRRSIRIVDAACGTASLLLHTIRTARMLGFVAIEARGVECDGALLAEARRVAATIQDPAIDLTFHIGTAEAAMRDEIAFPADILLYTAAPEQIGVQMALARRAGRLALAGPRSGAGA
ncbi:SAM-dependent methyltransferase [Sphingomonas sp. R1]|uniref:SAM-dependent methyltransferase n=1 Tax=Sphingomonas sp. R1 TaxID=399176 RepID=UPI002224E715|nr:SAM-dependent methyltransferase [Sphingomonas sp. R1]UYY77546.1 SAM-dependent methyltransferase [Sphingomonas sp. R1]